MEIDSLTVRLHHSGEFMKTKYCDGSCETYHIDRDLFSYSVLMEFVKDLKFDEIGGLYIKNRGWTLVTDDQSVTHYTAGRSEADFYIDCNVDKGVPPMKQMQPHVIVRPRSSPFKFKEKNADKRTFVTLKNLNAERTRKLKDMTEVKERLMHTKKKLMFNNDDEGHVTEEPTSKVAMKHVDARGPVARQIGFQESGGSKETVNAYEQRRNEIVASNKAKMRELGLGQSKSDGRKENREKTPRINEDASESDYVPDNDEHAQLEQSDDDLDNIVTSKVHFTTHKRKSMSLACS